MSLLTFSPATRTHTGRGMLHAAADLLRSFSAEWSYGRASRALHGLDDAALSDIGIARGEIDDAVRNGRAGLAR